MVIFEPPRVFYNILQFSQDLQIKLKLEVTKTVDIRIFLSIYLGLRNIYANKNRRKYLMQNISAENILK